MIVILTEKEFGSNDKKIIDSIWLADFVIIQGEFETYVAKSRSSDVEGNTNIAIGFTDLDLQKISQINFEWRK